MKATKITNSDCTAAMAGADLNGILSREVDDHCNAQIFSMIGPGKDDSETELLKHKLQLAQNSVSELDKQLLQSQKLMKKMQKHIDDVTLELKSVSGKYDLAKNEASQNAAALKKNIALSEELRHNCDKLHHERSMLERHILETEEQKDMAEVRAAEAETRALEAEERRALAVLKAAKAEKLVAGLEERVRIAEKRAMEAEKHKKEALLQTEGKLRRSHSHDDMPTHETCSNQVSVSQRASRKRSAALASLDSVKAVTERELVGDISSKNVPATNGKSPEEKLLSSDSSVHSPTAQRLENKTSQVKESTEIDSQNLQNI